VNGESSGFGGFGHQRKMLIMLDDLQSIPPGTCKNKHITRRHSDTTLTATTGNLRCGLPA